MTRHRPGGPRPDDYWALRGLAELLAALALLVAAIALLVWAV